MKFWCYFLFVFSFALSSCSVFKKEEYDVQVSEVVDGTLFVTRKACFFVPNGYCEYLGYDNSNGANAKALIVDHFVRKDELQFMNPIVAKIKMLPNKDSTDIIVWLERCHFEIVGEDECYIISAKVMLTSYFKTMQYLSFSYVLRFNWKDTIYNYECIYKGSPIYCEVISLNESQQHKIINTQSLPIGVKKELMEYN